jgi:uncharacterized protein (PEP-CTERM system associated)
MTAGLVQAQDAPAGRGLTLSSFVDTQASYLVNSRQGGLDAGQWVAELRPGFRLDSRAGRVVGSLGYSLGLAYRSRDSGSDDVRHSLSAQFSAEAVPRALYVDLAASISQQLANPFGVQSAPGSSVGDSNRLEVGTASVSPYTRGVLGGAVSYELRLNASTTNARRSIVADSSSWGGSLSLSSTLAGTALGWGFNASSQESEFRTGRPTRNDRYFGSLSYLPDPDVTLSLRAGQESTDVGGPVQQRFDNWGGGITWRPSPRTRVQFDGEDRFFGSSYRALIEHRMSQTSIQLSSNRSDNQGGAAAVPVTNFALADFEASRTESDPVRRQQLALALLGTLDPNAVAFVGFVNTGVTVAENHALSVSYAGRRVSGGAQAFASRTKVIGSQLASSEPVQQQGLTVNLGYRLAPDMSLTATGSLQQTKATATLAGTSLKSASLGLGTQLGRRTSANFSARYSVFNSSTDPYREAAVTAALNHRF